MARRVLSSDDHGPLIALISWILLAWAALTVITKVFLKFRPHHRLALDDLWISVSLVFAAAESIVFHFQFSRDIDNNDDLPVVRDSRHLKLAYAIKLLWVPALFFAKVAAIWMLYSLSRERIYVRTAQFIGVLIVIWAVSSEFLFAFPCRVPYPWDIRTGNCYNISAVEYYVGILNLITEVLLIVFPCVVITRLNMVFRQKISVLFFLLLRIVVIFAIIAELVARSLAVDTSDPNTPRWISNLCRQIVLCTCIICSSAIYIKPFMDSLESGFTRFDDVRRLEESKNQTTRFTWSTKQHSIPRMDSPTNGGTDHLDLPGDASYVSYEMETIQSDLESGVEPLPRTEANGDQERGT